MAERDNYEDLEMKRVEALESQNAAEYFKLSNQLGLNPNTLEDKPLYERGEADIIYDSGEEFYTDNIDNSGAEKPEKVRTLYGFWGEFVPGLERVIQKNGHALVGIRIDKDGGYHPGAGHSIKVAYDSLVGTFFNTYREDDRRLRQEEALDEALGDLAYNVRPYDAHLEEGKSNSGYKVIIGDRESYDSREAIDEDDSQKPAKLSKTERRYADFLARANKCNNIPQMRELLQELWPEQYGKGRGTDLHVRPASAVRRIFDNRFRKARGR